MHTLRGTCLFLARVAVVLGLFVMAEVFGASGTAYQPEVGTYSAEGHFTWCGTAKSIEDKIKRYEGFWEQQKPAERDGYDDSLQSLHIRLVRHCAYRLAELYAAASRPKDCQKMVKWLESEDDAFEVERSDEGKGGG